MGGDMMGGMGPKPNSSGALLMSLMKSMGGGADKIGGPPKGSASKLRGVIDELREIADEDPRLAERITDAITMLQGSGGDDGESAGGRGPGPTVGSLVPGIKTPI